MDCCPRDLYPCNNEQCPTPTVLVQVHKSGPKGVCTLTPHTYIDMYGERIYVWPDGAADLVGAPYHATCLGV